MTNEAKRSEESSSTVELGLLARIRNYLRQLAPHARSREAAVLLEDAKDEITAWRMRFPQYEYIKKDECVALRIDA